MICKKGSRDTKRTNNGVENKIRYMNSHGIGKWDYLNPLGKVIFGHGDPFVAFWHWVQWHQQDQMLNMQMAMVV